MTVDRAAVVAKARDWIINARNALRAASTIGERSCRPGDGLNDVNHDRLIQQSVALLAALDAQPGDTDRPWNADCNACEGRASEGCSECPDKPGDTGPAMPTCPCCGLHTMYGRKCDVCVDEEHEEPCRPGDTGQAGLTDAERRVLSDVDTRLRRLGFGPATVRVGVGDWTTVEGYAERILAARATGQAG